MPTELQALLFIVAAVAAVLLLIFYVLPRALASDAATPDGAVPFAQIAECVAAEGSLRTDSWDLEPSHRAPTDPYTPEQAHMAMQQHRDCATDRCAAKHSAFWTLADEKCIVPDARAVR
ncbi:hypothetical protein [Nocardia sp. NPDC051463]|uniref:hypothetical protein n=1 Tax=Nocardia sp. NPDC051463 TaxID=3154845 RepID=UPI00344CCCA1